MKSEYYDLINENLQDHRSEAADYDYTKKIEVKVAGDKAFACNNSDIFKAGKKGYGTHYYVENRYSNAAYNTQGGTWNEMVVNNGDGYVKRYLVVCDETRYNIAPTTTPYVALVAFCFSMTIGVLWEFFEFSVDRLFHMDMQKDTIVHTISSVMLDPTNKNIPITIDGITSVAVNGKNLGFDGYLDIGLYDTMEDLLVNFIGALTFSIFGYFYIKRRGKGRIAKAFIPTITTEDKELDAPHEQLQAQDRPEAPEARDG